MAIPLNVPSDATQRIIRRLFPKSDQAEATRLLTEECNAESMHWPSANQGSVERCHFAALKLSNGKLEQLIKAIALGETDYRDLLMSAGFGENVGAHLDWYRQLQ